MNRITEREKQVLACLCKGMSQKEAAFFLGIALATFKCHLQNASDKIDAKTTAQATAMHVSEFGMPT